MVASKIDIQRAARVEIKGRFCLLGHEDVLSNRPYTNSVRCLSKKGGSYYSCKAADFYNILYHDDQSRRSLR